MSRFRKSQSRFGVLAVLITLCLWGGRGCYSPQISSTLGLQCAALPAKQCPDGFSCAGTRCVRGDGTGGAGLSGGTGGTPGTGGIGGSCATPIAPLCSGSTTTGCDPVCQTGCACGLKCGVTPSGATCSAPLGTKGTGAICQLGADDCAPGDVCMRELCGTNLGRCYRYCRAGDLCAGFGCNTTVTLDTGATTQQACNLSDSTCNIYDGTGCPDLALKCYASGTHSKCDCPSPSGPPLGVGDPCFNYNDCGTGLMCLTVGGSTQCHQLCRTSADCGGTICMPLGTIGGYCP